MDDLRTAIRALWRARGTSALAVLTLALGLGANTALFSLIQASLFRPLPFAQADRVVRIWEVTREDPTGSGTLAPGDVYALAHASREFEALAGYRATSFNLEGGDEPERVAGAVVSPSFFHVFAVQPRAGRMLQESSTPGPREAVVSESLWRRRFGANTALIGGTLELGGEPVLVTGVVPAGFDLPSGTELWLSGKYWVPENPLRPGVDVSSSRTSHYLFAAGRLRPGVSAQGAAAELGSLARAIAPEDPDLAFRVVGFREDLAGLLFEVRSTDALTYGAAALTLAVVALLASGLGGRGASSLEPSIALQGE